MNTNDITPFFESFWTSLLTMYLQNTSRNTELSLWCKPSFIFLKCQSLLHPCKKFGEWSSTGQKKKIFSQWTSVSFLNPDSPLVGPVLSTGLPSVVIIELGTRKSLIPWTRTLKVWFTAIPFFLSFSKDKHLVPLTVSSPLGRNLFSIGSKWYI